MHEIDDSSRLIGKQVIFDGLPYDYCPIPFSEPPMDGGSGLVKYMCETSAAEMALAIISAAQHAKLLRLRGYVK